VSISTPMIEVDGSGRTTGGRWVATIRGQDGDDAEPAEERVLALISITSISREDGERTPTVMSFGAEPVADADPDADPEGSREGLGDPFAAFRRGHDQDS